MILNFYFLSASCGILYIESKALFARFGILWAVWYKNIIGDRSKGRRMTLIPRMFCALGGVFGVLGVLCYAIAAHLDAFYNSAAHIFSSSASIVLVLALVAPRHPSRLLYAAGLFICLGTVLFTGAVTLSHLYNIRPVAYAAPLGGILIMLGWVNFILLALRPSSKKGEF